MSLPGDVKREVPASDTCRYSRQIIMRDEGPKGKPIIMIRPSDSCLPDGQWEFDSLVDAMAAYLRWDGNGEPEGWNRRPSPSYSVYRPDGTPESEYRIDKPE